MATTEKLLEREAELRELEAALVAAASDSGRMVLVEAPAGIGKTSLLAAASLIADGLGFTALRARATELERDFAYGCVRQLLEPTVVRAADPERERLWHGAAELARGLFGPDSDPRSSEGDFAFLHGLYWLVSNLAEERPLLLCVDDVHWADAESLRFLNYLAPRLDGLPVAVVACARTGERPIAELSRLATAPEARVLRPRPLSTGASATVCRRALGDGVAPEFVAACRKATGGNPFFLEALLREVREREIAPDAAGARQVESIGPAAVTEALRVRLAERPPAATALVRAVAVLGDGSRLGEAALLAGLGEQEAARTADLLAALSILREADGLEFTHPIVREAVFAQIGPLERGEWHARAAEILAANRGSEERIAAQLVGAPPAADPERVALLRRVAADALARGAPRSAGAWLARALAEPPPAEELAAVLVGLGSAELRIGAPGAVEHLEAAVELISEPELLATAACQLGNALTISGRADEAVEALERTLDAVASQRREHGLTMVAELASHAQQGSVELREPAAELLERQTGLAGETPGERLVLAGLAFNRARAAESEGEAAELLERALAGGRLVGELRYDLIGPVYDVIVGLLATDALELADRCVADALADARARASVPSVAFLTDRRGWAAIRRGDVAPSRRGGDRHHHPRPRAPAQRAEPRPWSRRSSPRWARSARRRRGWSSFAPGPAAKVFSAGHDVDELPETRRDPLGWDDPLRQLVREIETFPGPVIAMVEGSVWGGATETVFACDLIVAAEAATFAVTPAKLGVPYNVGGMLTFLNAASLRIVKEMIFTAQPVDAVRAERLGMINHVVPAPELEAFTWASPARSPGTRR